MIGGNVQRFEVVEVVFDLGTGGDVEARLAEQLLDAQPHLGDRMQAAARFAAARQRDVDAFLRELRGDVRLLELGALGFDEAAWSSSRTRLIRAPASLRWSAASLPSSLSFSVSQPLLPSERTRDLFERRPDRHALEIAPSVSARRASRSFGSPSAMTAVRRLSRLFRLSRERLSPASRWSQTLPADSRRDRQASCDRFRSRPSSGR